MAPTQAEVKLIPLKNCFVNVPQSIVTSLDNARAVVQNVVVELQYSEYKSGQISKKSNDSLQRSVYLGWTGMASTTKSTSLVDRSGRRIQENLGLVEIDTVFGRLLGLVDGQKVALVLHLNPPLAHTVHVEPLTSADWEIIELHAAFLESNLLFQVRALPNPSFTASPSSQARQAHPLTIHLSPTSTANVIISSLDPPQPSSIPFARIAPDGEVIVAPKTRPKLSQTNRRTSQSNGSTSRRSAGTRGGPNRQRSHRESTSSSSVFLRALDRSVCMDLFEGEEADKGDDDNLVIWIDSYVSAHETLLKEGYACVSIIRPAGIEPPLDPQQQQRIKDVEASEAGKPALKIVAQVRPWDDAPDPYHAALSSAVCSALDAKGIVGGLVRLAPASQRLSHGDFEVLKIYPFISGKSEGEGLKFGGQSKAARESGAQMFRALHAGTSEGNPGILDGPLTDGLVLSRNTSNSPTMSWNGGIVRFGSRPVDGKEPSKSAVNWCIGSEIKASIELQPEIPNAFSVTKSSALAADQLYLGPPSMTGVDSLIKKLVSHISHCSSVLLAGGLGSGKTSMAHLLGHQMRSRLLYQVQYFPCRKLVTDETRISSVKEVLTRIFMTASWGTKLDGRSLIILDDLDKLCPIETELQTSDNSRSRQVSELVNSLVRQYCGVNSGVVILATAQGKESVHNVIVGGNVLREIVSLKAPDKDVRRKLLQALMGPYRSVKDSVNGIDGFERTGDHDGMDDEVACLGESPRSNAVDAPERFHVDSNLDILDLAGQTDGYMPGDLVLLVSRAKNEALIRSVEAIPQSTDDSDMMLTKQDFQKALEGFKPASLRNVTLQSSKTTFDSIGGLHETRRILLETLQYPTTYAPIFAQCPLRLRSGLLLYGYPGCGKTLLASAVAGECGLNFISVKGPEILNKYIGASEKSVRDLFERAESAKPCVLFFDEFDSIAPKRGHDSTGVTDRVVNQLLTQMDGAEGLSGVYVLAATSRPDLIDPALLRPGRLDKALLCDMPSLEDRLDILQALSKKSSIAPAILNSSIEHKTLTEVATRTAGYSGADLQAVIYNAHLEAIHDILGDHDINGKINPKNRKESTKTHASSKRDIIQFRFGQGAGLELSPAQQAAEYADVVAKLDAVKLARRKERHARRGISTADNSAKQNGNASAGQTSKTDTVVIEWKHIEASLATTRSSISADERRRLERVYREFVVGRNGEMPDGQGSMEVGGRSSLM